MAKTLEFEVMVSQLRQEHEAIYLDVPEADVLDACYNSIEDFDKKWAEYKEQRYQDKRKQEEWDKIWKAANKEQRRTGENILDICERMRNT